MSVLLSTTAGALEAGHRKRRWNRGASGSPGDGRKVSRQASNRKAVVSACHQTLYAAVMYESKDNVSMNRDITYSAVSMSSVSPRNGTFNGHFASHRREACSFSKSMSYIVVFNICRMVTLFLLNLWQPYQLLVNMHLFTAYIKTYMHIRKPT